MSDNEVRLYFIMYSTEFDGGWFWGQDSKTNAIKGYTSKAEAERKAYFLNKAEGRLKDRPYGVVEVFA